MESLKKITISIDAHLLKQIEEKAEKENRKVSEFIRLLLHEAKGGKEND